VERACEKLGVSERRACRVLHQPRSTQRRILRIPDDERRLLERMVDLATQYGRYGYRRITAMLRAEGWRINHKRIERLWRRESLKVPSKQPKRGRLWLNDGSCVRLRPERRDHVWAYDIVEDRTHDGRSFRILTMVDEFTRECLAIDVARRITAEDVLERLTDLFIRRGVPEHIRSDNGGEFTATTVRAWLDKVGVKTLFIEPGSPWENGYVESFNGKLRDELLNGEIFYTLLEAKVLIERWREHYNRVRPHSSLGYRPPAPEAILLPDILGGSAPEPPAFPPPESIKAGATGGHGGLT
jgi:putative transposase